MRECEEHENCRVNKYGGHIKNGSIVAIDAEIFGYVERGAEVYGSVRRDAKVYGCVEEGATVGIGAVVKEHEIVCIGKGDLRTYWIVALKLLWQCRAYDKILGWFRMEFCWKDIRKEFAKLPINEQDEVIDTLKAAEEKLGITGYLEELTKEVRDD